MDTSSLQLLIRSFDAELTAAERARLEQALASDPELRREKERLERLRLSIAEQQYSFRPFFGERLQRRLRASSGETGSAYEFSFELASVFRKVAFSGLALILVLLGTLTVLEQALSVDALLGVESLSAESFVELDLYDF